MFRLHLLLACSVLYILSLHNAHAFGINRWAKQKPGLVGFSWSNCGPSSDPVQVKSLTVGPDPIQIPGNITVSTSFSIASSTATDLSLAVTMEYKAFGVWVKIPCVDNVGSCSYSGLCADWAQACPKYFEKYGIPCTCPIPANTYSIPDFSTSIDQKLPVKISGDVRITGNLVSASAGHLACLQLELNFAG